MREFDALARTASAGESSPRARRASSVVSVSRSRGEVQPTAACGKEEAHRHCTRPAEPTRPTLPPACDHVARSRERGPEVVCADPSASDRRSLRTHVQADLSRPRTRRSSRAPASWWPTSPATACSTRSCRTSSGPSCRVETTGGTPVEEAATRLAGHRLHGAVGGTAADVDGDGDFDLLVTRFQEPILLLRNDGTGHFADVTALAGLDKYAWRSQSSSWADFDRDGDLDLFVGSTVRRRSSTSTAPTSRRPTTVAAVAQQRRRHVHRLVRPAPARGRRTAGPSCRRGSTSTLDGYPELFTWHDFGTSHPSMVLKNEGGTALVPVLGRPRSTRRSRTWASRVADLNHDGLPDFATTSFEKTRLVDLAGDATNDAGALWIESSAPAGSTWTSSTGSRPTAGAPSSAISTTTATTTSSWCSATGRRTRAPGDPVDQTDGVWVQDEDGFVREPRR